MNIFAIRQAIKALPPSTCHIGLFPDPTPDDAVQAILDDMDDLGRGIEPVGTQFIHNIPWK